MELTDVHRMGGFACLLLSSSLTFREKSEESGCRVIRQDSAHHKRCYIHPYNIQPRSYSLDLLPIIVNRRKLRHSDEDILNVAPNHA